MFDQAPPLDRQSYARRATLDYSLLLSDYSTAVRRRADNRWWRSGSDDVEQGGTRHCGDGLSDSGGLEGLSGVDFLPWSSSWPIQ
jgi:hypothetical protein